MDDTNNNEIERYIHDKMDKNERFLFEKKMNENPDFKEDIILEINLHKTFNENFNTDTSILNDTQLIDHYTTELNTKEVKETSDFIRKSTLEFRGKKKTSFRLIYKFTAAAAAILLIAFLIKTNLQSNVNSYYEEYTDWNDLPSLIEKGDDKNYLIKIEQAFEAKNYTGVLTLIDDKSIDPYELIYKGVSYVKLEDYTKAKQTFNTLTKTYSLESSRGYWYLFLIYLKEKDTNNAKKMLYKILDSKYNYNYEMAVELIDEF